MAKRIQRIVLMEDDDLFSDWICEGLREEFGEEIQIDDIATEGEMWDKFDRLTQPPADAYILDIRVRWTHAGSKIGAPPPDKDDLRVAGLRCGAAIKERCPGTPVILFSVLERTDIEQLIGVEKAKNVAHIPKSDGMEALVRELRRQLKNPT